MLNWRPYYNILTLPQTTNHQDISIIESLALYFVSMSSLYSRNKFTSNTFQKQSSWGVLQKVLLEEFHKTHWKNLQWSPLCVCVFNKVLFIKLFSEFWDEYWTPAKRAASRICKLTIVSIHVMHICILSMLEMTIQWRQLVFKKANFCL